MSCSRPIQLIPMDKPSLSIGKVSDFSGNSFKLCSDRFLWLKEKRQQTDRQNKTTIISYWDTYFIPKTNTKSKQVIPVRCLKNFLVPSITERMIGPPSHWQYTQRHADPVCLDMLWDISGVLMITGWQELKVFTNHQDFEWNQRKGVLAFRILWNNYK